jgi:hypothetical protein
MTNYGQISHKRGVRTLSNSHKRATIIDNLFVRCGPAAAGEEQPRLYTHSFYYKGIHSYISSDTMELHFRLVTAATLF